MTAPLRFLIVGVVVCSYVQFPLLWTLLGLRVSTHIYESQ